MPDDPSLNAVLINGVHTPATPAVLKSVAPSSSVYTFTAPFSFVWRGHNVTYRRGQSDTLDAPLKAFLLSIGAPMTAA